MKRLAAALFVLAISSTPSLAQLTQLEGPYWDRGGTVPNLYYFKSDGTGLRTGYVTGLSNASGSQFPFAWSLQNNVLVLQFPTGYTDRFVITGHDQNRGIIYREGEERSAAWGPGPWFGCASGQIPPLIAKSLC
jgi:hypothetical protein